MRLVYSSAYSPLYYPAYYLAYPASRDCPPLADTHFPPRGTARWAALGEGEKGETFLPIFPTLPPLLLYYLLFSYY